MAPSWVPPSYCTCSSAVSSSVGSNPTTRNRFGPAAAWRTRTRSTAVTGGLNQFRDAAQCWKYARNRPSSRLWSAAPREPEASQKITTCLGGGASCPAGATLGKSWMQK